MVRRVAIVLAPLGGCALALGLDAPSFDAADLLEAAADAPADVEAGNVTPPPPPAEKLSEGNGEVLDLALDDDNVYFTSFDRGSLARLAKTGGVAAFLVPPDGGLREPTAGLAASGAYVYVSAYASGGGPGARRLPKEGGIAETIDACNTAYSIAVDDTDAYWLTAACGSPMVRLRKVSKTDLDASVVEAPPDDATKYAVATYGYLALDATAVYWMNASEVHSVDKSLAAGTARTLFTAKPGDLARGLAVDDRVYAVFGASLLAIDKASGAASTLATDIAIGGRVGVATDATHVYFTNPDGRVLRVGKSGGTPETLAEGQAQPTGLAIDATHVYWSNADGGSIMRAAY
jgi:hypothetical protein